MENHIGMAVISKEWHPNQIQKSQKYFFLPKTKCEILEIFLDHQKENEKPAI